MKALFSLVFIMLTAASYSQLDEQKKLLYEHKVESFIKMRSLGNTMIFLGVVGIGGGLYMASEGKKKLESDDFDSWDKGQKQYDWGVIIASLGGTMFFGGMVLSGIGSSKVRQYREKLKLGIIYDGNTKGLWLVYRF